MRLLIFGPPGAGKGTQGSTLAHHLGVPTISTGEIFRRNIRDSTALGKEVEAVIGRGEYVPDALTNALVGARLQEQDVSEGFLLDGYPRTPGQLQALDGFLGALGHRLDAVLHLVVGDEEVTSRLLRRAHLEGRSDDTAPVIAQRLKAYKDETTPLLMAYRARRLVRDVDGSGSVEGVAGRLREALESAGADT